MAAKRVGAPINYFIRTALERERFRGRNRLFPGNVGMIILIAAKCINKYKKTHLFGYLNG